MLRQFATRFALGVLLGGCAHSEWDRRFAAPAPVTDAPIFSGCVDPDEFSGSCGLVSRQLGNREALVSFTRDVCREPGDASSDECRARFYRLFLERMIARYPRADPVEVDDACSRSEGRCVTATERELLLMASHNRHVAALGRPPMPTYDPEAERIDEERRRQSVETVQRQYEAIERNNRTLVDSVYPRPTPSVPIAPGCTSDFSCAYGSKCLKEQGRIDGFCAKVVDDYGNQVYRAPRSHSVAPGPKPQCASDYDCQPMFACVKGYCLQR